LDYIMDLLAFHAEGNTSMKAPHPCSVDPPACSGLCVGKAIGSNLTAMCTCSSHYVLAADGVSCRGPASFLLFSQKNKISRLLVDGAAPPGEVPDIVLPIKRARSIQALDYNPWDQMIYWVDHGKGDQPARGQVIKRARDTGETDKLGLFEKVDKFLPFDIAIDPFTQLLYWTCETANTINVTRISSGDMKPLGPLLQGGGEDLPRLLAIFPLRQILFVSISGEAPGGARLDMIHLQTGEKLPLVNTSMGEITAMAVDPDTSSVYWTDIILKRMDWIVLETRERRTLISEGLIEPVGLAVQGAWVYWADRDQASIVRVDKLTGTSRQIVLSKISRLSSLFAVNYIPAEVLAAHPCHSPDRHGCSHYCAPATEGVGGGGVVCYCPVGQVLLDDRKTCGLPSCKSTEFTCAGKGPSGDGPMCIPHTWRCDGQVRTP
jgi:low density lipoprotein receptor-related protein 5/6